MAFSNQRGFEPRFLTGHARLRFAFLAAVLALAVTAPVAAAVTLPPGWSHAEVNVVINHRAHTMIYDRGILIRIARRSLTLKEPDSSVVFVRVAASAVVTLDGHPVSLPQLRRGEFAQTVRVDGNPAQQVHARHAAVG